MRKRINALLLSAAIHSPKRSWRSGELLLGSKTENSREVEVFVLVTRWERGETVRGVHNVKESLECEDEWAWHVRPVEFFGTAPPYRFPLPLDTFR